MISITSKQSALATPVVRESWPGARRRRGKGRNVQGKVLVTVSPRRRAAMGSPANALMNQKQMTRISMQWKIFLSFAFDSSM